MSDNKDYAALIGEELAKAETMKDEIPKVVGMLRIKSANETLLEAQQRPDPNPLWMTLWYEGEVCCLFADSNLGKSIYAVQIGESIARTQRVLYFDFELSDKQFQLRYTNEQDELHHFPEIFYRIDIEKESLDVANFEDNIISNIEDAALRTGAKVLIIVQPCKLFRPVFPLFSDICETIAKTAPDFEPFLLRFLRKRHPFRDAERKVWF